MPTCCINLEFQIISWGRCKNNIHDSRKIFQNTYQISWKWVQWEQSCFMGRTDRSKYMTKPKVALRNFANVPKSKNVGWGQNVPYDRTWRPRGGIEVQLDSLFNLGARWTWVVNATNRALYHRYPFYRRLCGSQGPSGRIGKSRPSWYSYSLQTFVRYRRVMKWNQ